MSDMNKDEIISKAIQTAEQALALVDKRDEEIVLLRKMIVLHEGRYQDLEKAYDNLVHFSTGYAKKTFGL